MATDDASLGHTPLYALLVRESIPYRRPCNRRSYSSVHPLPSHSGHVIVSPFSQSPNDHSPAPEHDSQTLPMVICSCGGVLSSYLPRVFATHRSVSLHMTFPV